MRISPRWKPILYRSGLALGLALFAYQVWLAISALRAAQNPLQLRPLGMLLALDLAAYTLLIVGWFLITRALRLQLSPRHLFHGYVLAFLPRYIPGSIWGYVSRGEWMRRTCGASYAQSSAASVMEISVQFGSAGLVVLLGLTPSGWQPAAMIAGLVVLAVPWWLLLRFHLQKQQISGARLWWRWVLLLLLYALFWTIHGLTISAAMAAIGASARLSLQSATFVFCASWLAGFVAIFVPAGLGVREMTLAALLQQMTAVSASEASLVAVLTRLSIIAAELVFLLIAGVLTLYTLWRKQPREYSVSYAPDHSDPLL